MSLDDLIDMLDRSDDREATCMLESGQPAGLMKQVAENMGYTVATNGEVFTIMKPKRKPINYKSTGTV